MPDILSIVTFSAGGRPVEVLDLNDSTNYYRDRDAGITFTPGVSSVQYSKSSRRFGGGRAVGETHDNGSIGWSAYVTASSGTIAAQKIETLLAEIQEASRGRYLMVAPEGGRATYLEIAGPGTWQPQIRPREFADSHSMMIAITFPVLPLVQWDRMRLVDDFSIDTIADYSFDTGTFVVTGGKLTVGTGVPHMVHTGRGYLYGDVEVTVKLHTAATMGTSQSGVMLNNIDVNNYLYAVVTGGTATTSFRIGKRDSGTLTGLANGTSFTPLDNTDYWIRFRQERNVLTADLFTSKPSPFATPLQTAGPFTLTGADATKFGAGVTGKVGILTHNLSVAKDETWDDFTVEPYTYHNRTLPDVIPLGGDIPGDAPALAEVTVTHSGGAAAPVFALVAWSSKPSVFSYLANGDFAVDTTGWKITADDNVQAATSITRVTADPQAVGGTAGEVVTPATTLSGASYRIYGDFRAGVTYTFGADLWAPSSTTSTSVIVGRTGDAATSASINLTPTKLARTATWTPTADHDYAVIGVKINNAVLTTFRFANAYFYEGTIAPTLYSQLEGRGGRAPFGIFVGQSATDLSGWAITSNATARGGFRLEDATVSGAETYTASWIIDPATLTAGDFTAGEIAIEVWGRYLANALNVTPKVVWSVRPLDGTNFGLERFTSEWGSAGQLLTLPLSGTALRWRRFGTITLPVDPLQPRAVKLWVTASVAAGSTGTFALDYICLAPVQSRALSPTDVALTTAYPKFLASTAETMKTIRADLSAVISDPPANPSPDHGLGGNIVEMPCGPVGMLAKLSSLVPGDPTIDTSTEQLSHTSRISVAPIPRSFMLRA